MKKLLFVIVIPMLFLGCEKRTLMDGELEIFVGKWKWYATTWFDNSYPVQQHYVYATNHSTTYNVEITSKGIMY